MKKIFLLCILPMTLFAQPIAEKKIQERREKLELIMRLQDLRTVHDGKLISFLSDGDPIVRERAALAFGSIQDTALLTPLIHNLTDPDSAVQFAAAFAIGQTAGQLSRKSRQILEYDLIWARLDQTQAVDRLIEEMGKFGSEQALYDLLLRFGNVFPRVHTTALVMSIARFAIRGITSIEAVRYLLTLIKPPEATPWQVVYALQRIGDHNETRQELEHIVQLYKHTDPLVRMHLAMLLGKIRDEKTSLEPLQKLADFDPDWRVRVNALKALGNFKLKGHDEIIETFRRAFSSGNEYVALTALSTFGNTGLKEKEESQKVRETFALLRRMAENKDNGYLWQLQGEAAIALATLSGDTALSSIKLSTFPQRLLQAQLLEALGYTGSSKVMENLLEYAKANEPVLYRAALEGLRILSQKNSSDSIIIQETYNACLKALSSGDVAVVTTAASMLGDSLFLRPTSVSPLIETLSSLRIPYDVDAMQEIASTLGRLKDKRAIPILTQKLQLPDRSVAFASASALTSITGQEYLSQIPRSFEPLLTDFDFVYLRSLRDTIRVKMETIRGDVVIDLYKNVAPFTVMSFLKLSTQRGFYRGLSFHRVVPNFVIQGGDPRGDGWGGPGYSIRSEFSPLTYETGMVGMASAGKDTEGSQFFIIQSPQPHLDGRYTIFGKVISGTEIVNKILVDDHIFDVKLIR